MTCALTARSVSLKKNDDFSKLAVLQLKEYMKLHPEFLKQVMFFASKITTRKPFWHSRCNELLDMVLQNGDPTVIFTLSSADFHWPEPNKLLGVDVSALSVK